MITGTDLLLPCAPAPSHHVSTSGVPGGDTASPLSSGGARSTGASRLSPEPASPCPWWWPAGGLPLTGSFPMLSHSRVLPQSLQHAPQVSPVLSLDANPHSQVSPSHWQNRVALFCSFCPLEAIAPEESLYCHPGSLGEGAERGAWVPFAVLARGHLSNPRTAAPPRPRVRPLKHVKTQMKTRRFSSSREECSSDLSPVILQNLLEPGSGSPCPETVSFARK